MQYTFLKPYTFGGKTYKTVDLCLELLTGRDVLDIKKQLVSMKMEPTGMGMVLSIADENFVLMVAAKAAGQPLEFFEQMPLADYSMLTQLVKNFLLGADGQQESAEKSASSNDA